MGDKDGFFAGIGKVYVSDKPIDFASLSDVELRGAFRGGGKIDAINAAFDAYLEEHAVEWHEIADLSADGLSVDGDGSSETENHFADGVPFTATLNFEIADKKGQELCRKLLHLPKLPRKLKKRVKKHYFDQYPKRISAQILRYVFAVNNPNKSRKLGIYIGVDVAKDESVHNVVMWANSEDYINQLERAYQQTKINE